MGRERCATPRHSDTVSDEIRGHVPDIHSGGPNHRSGKHHYIDPHSPDNALSFGVTCAIQM
jgi:hypothetical protein